VLHAFGVSRATLLEGGQGDSWRADGLVFKRFRSPAELEWLDSLPPTTAVRTARPARAADGRLTVAGWSAMPYLVGRHEAGRWHDIAEAGRSLSREYRGLVEPQWARARTDPWATADRVAWDESPVPADAPAWLQELAVRRIGIDRPAALVHGDLTGNVLFEPGLPPAIIDVSAYFRPPEYAVAIVVVDAVCFEGAPPELRMLVAGPEPAQLLLRALLFRAVTDVIRDGTAARARYLPALALLDSDY
jgi:uncharacterized protein (TIGR02569 family)